MTRAVNAVGKRMLTKYRPQLLVASQCLTTLQCDFYELNLNRPRHQWVRCSHYTRAYPPIPCAGLDRPPVRPPVPSSADDQSEEAQASQASGPDA